jgi:transcriptional regulator with XRE-family HTH domain
MPYIGEVIRQVRRLRNLTQQELAGERFSKSYVSAVEHNRDAPSGEALRYFAERLGEPSGDFTALLQQADVAKALTVLKSLPLVEMNGLLKRPSCRATPPLMKKDRMRRRCSATEIVSHSRRRAGSRD